MSGWRQAGVAAVAGRMAVLLAGSAVLLAGCEESERAGPGGYCQRDQQCEEGLVCLSLECTRRPIARDAGGGSMDEDGGTDAGVPDAGTEPDAGGMDAGPDDAGPEDAGPEDARSPEDAGPEDASTGGDDAGTDAST